MKKLLFVIFVFFLSCSKTSQTPKDTVRINISLCKTRYFCLSIINNTDTAFYIPEIRGLYCGLRVYYSINGNWCDITDEAKTSFIYSSVHSDESKELKECCPELSWNYPLSSKEEDSISNEIVSHLYNKTPCIITRIKDRIIKSLDKIIFLKPHGKYQEYFFISDSYKSRHFGLWFCYPYSWKKSGSSAWTIEQAQFYKKVLDSLAFPYPNNILGHLLYTKQIESNLFIYSE